MVGLSKAPPAQGPYFEMTEEPGLVGACPELQATALPGARLHLWPHGWPHSLWVRVGLRASGFQSQANGQPPPPVPQLTSPTEDFCSLSSVLLMGLRPLHLLEIKLIRLIVGPLQGWLPRPVYGGTFWFRAGEAGLLAPAAVQFLSRA